MAKETERQHKEEVTKATSSPPWPYITIGVVLTIVMLAIVAISWAWVSAALYHTNSNEWSNDRQATRESFEERGQPDRGERFFGGQGSLFDEMFGVSASGVVTKIDGDMVTVAGQGKQVTVVMTDDTVVSGSETSLSVNDTVIVIGEEDSDTVTAVRVIVRNETGAESWFLNQPNGRPNA